MRWEVLGSVNEIQSRREAQKILDSKLRPINQGRQLPQFTIPLEQFAREQWEPAMLPTLKVGSARLLRQATALPRTARFGNNPALRHYASEGSDLPRGEPQTPAFQVPAATECERNSARFCKPGSIGPL